MNLPRSTPRKWRNWNLNPHLVAPECELLTTTQTASCLPPPLLLSRLASKAGGRKTSSKKYQWPARGVTITNQWSQPVPLPLRSKSLVWSSQPSKGQSPGPTKLRQRPPQALLLLNPSTFSFSRTILGPPAQLHVPAPSLRHLRSLFRESFGKLISSRESLTLQTQNKHHPREKHSWRPTALCTHLYSNTLC